TDVWSFKLSGRNVTVVMYENEHLGMYCFDTGAPTIDCYNHHGEKNVVANHNISVQDTPVSTAQTYELTCSAPTLSLGKQDRFLVSSIKKTNTGSYGTIAYVRADGTVYEQNQQYDVPDTSTADRQQWTGHRRSNIDITEIGDLTGDGTT